VRRSARTRRTAASTLSLTRWGGAAACLAGLCYGAWGYLDAPDSPAFVMSAVVPALGLATPVLFLGGFVGLYSGLGGGGLLRMVGLLVGTLGTVLGVVHELGWWESEWWALLFAGLLAVGLGTVVGGTSRLLGSLVLISGALGWVSLLTDPTFPDVWMSARQVHVAFAALFCLSCVAWGLILVRHVSQPS
jgi:hypothetical protein